MRLTPANNCRTSIPAVAWVQPAIQAFSLAEKRGLGESWEKVFENTASYKIGASE